MDIFLEKLIRWSAPYSPFDPLENETIELEMEALSLSLYDSAIEELIRLKPNDEDELYQYMRFMSFFLERHNSDYVISYLMQQLQCHLSAEIIEFIGYLKLPDLYDKFINYVNYSKLNINEKDSLVVALLLMRNKKCMEYVAIVRTSETNKDIIEQLDMLYESAAVW